MRYIVIDWYDEDFPVIITDDNNEPIIFNSHSEAKNLSIIAFKPQIVPKEVENEDT